MKRTIITVAVASAAMLSAAQAQTIGTATTDLNVRSGPDPQFPVIGMIRENRRTTVFGCIEGSRWCQVDLRGQTGWAYSQYMTFAGDAVVALQAPELEVAPAMRTTIVAAPQPLPPAPIAPVAIPVPVPGPVATWQPPAQVYTAAPTVTYQSPAPVITYRAPATTTVVETTAVAPRDFAGRLIPRRETIYAATTPPRAYVPPRSVRTFIADNALDPVYLEGSLMVGAGIPDDIDLVPVPGSRFNYVYVNDYPVLVDPRTRRIVYVSR